MHDVPCTPTPFYCSTSCLSTRRRRKQIKSAEKPIGRKVERWQLRICYKTYGVIRKPLHQTPYISSTQIPRFLPIEKPPSRQGCPRSTRNFASRAPHGRPGTAGKWASMERPKNGTTTPTGTPLTTFVHVCPHLSCRTGFACRDAPKEKQSWPTTTFAGSDTYASFMQDQLNSQLLPSGPLKLPAPTLPTLLRTVIGSPTGGWLATRSSFICPPVCAFELFGDRPVSLQPDCTSTLFFVLRRAASDASCTG